MDILNKIIPSNQCEKYYDPDSSPEAWEHYDCVYESMFDDLFAFKFETKYRTIQNSRVKYKRYVQSIGHHDEYPRIFKLGGETDFNFNKKKYAHFAKILNDDKNGKDLLEECKKHHHTLKNFSLMPVTGRINNFKGSRCRGDRLDVFAMHLNDFYIHAGCKKDTAIIKYASPENKKWLIKYLSNFCCVYNYFNKIYFIKCEQLINELIKNGETKLSRPCDLIRYMELAKRFWNEKEKNLAPVYNK
ncbi:MAG: hypothetical protein FWC16_04580 [Defluviitaleaceae bacterium]|nr:hypothetical protein [Defluviitaleaceae bacterium]MCL2274184.1 hypothetical protein [Defluviitaleaceae bacterium]